MKRILVAALLSGIGVGCGDKKDEESEQIEYTPLDAVSALHRVSLALRGVRPSQADIDAVTSDPDQLLLIADGYVASDEFADTIRDMYAERLLMRASTVLPPLGELTGSTSVERQWALSEEPLDIIADVVRHDDPFGNIVTADWTVLDETSSLMWANHTYNQATGGKQIVSFTDGRRSAGILTSNSYLIRHESNGANYHRGRANTLADTMLCASFSGRDIPITGDIDLSDDDAVADALNNNPQCISCHETVDPLAAHYWNYRPRLTPFQVVTAYNNEEGGCDANLPQQFSCYPVATYFDVNITPVLDQRGLRYPAYWGAQTNDMVDVGQAIADDPRFAACAAKTFAAYLTQTPMEELDAEAVARFQQVFSENDQSAQALALAIVTDEAFLASDVSGESTPALAGVQVLRPEQMERMIENWSGFRVEYGVSRDGYGDVRFFMDDNLGFRAMSGGIDGRTVTSPTHTPTPVKLLAFATYAEESAGFIVEAEFRQSAGSRTLLSGVEASTRDESTIRQQLVSLHQRLFGASVETDDPSVSALFNLWTTVQQSSTPQEAWTVTLSAMFQSPDILFY